MSAHPVVREEEAWERAAETFLGAEATIVAVSRWLGDSRVYRAGEEVAVVRSLRTVRGGENSLEAAGRILHHLGRDVAYVTRAPWECLRMPRLDGTTLESRLSRLSFSARMRIVAAVASELRMLHAQGVAHRDVRRDNVMLLSSGGVELIDFDRALLCGPWRAGLTDWLPLSRKGSSANTYLKFALVTLVPRFESAGLRLRYAFLRGRRATRQDGDDGDDIRLLRSAWQLARASPANAPGQGLAYYAFTYKNHHFVGERPWYLRWEAIRRTVEFTGKRVLDLGTNMGLLPTFALLHGAEHATGVDLDAGVLRAARLVARALGVSPTFERVDLAREPGWERGFGDVDMVSAMSVLKWLPENRRVLNFLETTPEIVYEGHDTLAVELDRLRAIGFNKVDVLMETERGRSLLHGRRA